MSKQPKVNTTKSVRESKVTTAQLDKEMKDIAKLLGDQKKVKVTIPQYLKERLGSTVPVSINGATIHVPVGQTVEIPEDMATILNESLANLQL